MLSGDVVVIHQIAPPTKEDRREKMAAVTCLSVSILGMTWPAVMDDLDRRACVRSGKVHEKDKSAGAVYAALVTELSLAQPFPVQNLNVEGAC